MTPLEFKSWRKRLGWRHVDAASHLGLKIRTISSYENDHTKIPLAVELACKWLAHGSWKSSCMTFAHPHLGFMDLMKNEAIRIFQLSQDQSVTIDGEVINGELVYRLSIVRKEIDKIQQDSS